MPPHHSNIATIRPRSLANVLADLKEARRDYDDALGANDADAEDRATEAETRLEDLRADFDARLIAATGLSFEALLKAREECLL
jgi:hypothetical protein